MLRRVLFAVIPMIGLSASVKADELTLAGDLDPSSPDSALLAAAFDDDLSLDDDVEAVVGSQESDEEIDGACWFGRRFFRYRCYPRYRYYGWGNRCYRPYFTPCYQPVFCYPRYCYNYGW